MVGFDRDRGLDTLLDLHGQTLFVDEVGHWVKFVVRRTEVSAERPHGLRYSLTLHAPDGTRLVGFDNAHPVLTGEGRARDCAGRATTTTGCGSSGLTNTQMLSPSSKISGQRSTAF